MVSLWPWKSDDNSPASFEKTLATLSAKITRSTSRLDSLRQRSRRLIVLWTLYAGFAYLLYTIILVLVVGWRRWGIPEYSAVAAGPILIYLIRLGLSTYYDYRTSSIQRQLEEQEKQRDSNIEKLKAATKYNSTQELLKKYGGTPSPKEKPSKAAAQKDTPKKESQGTPRRARTGFVPPPTANIPGRDSPSPAPMNPQHAAPQAHSPLGQQSAYANAKTTPPTQRLSSPQEEFAPNAFAAAPQYATANEGSRWYDRIMDVLLGEDESLPRARLALICGNCRLVNGQAPPGVKRLEDVGKWRCGGCGTMNEEESKAKKIVASIRDQASTDADDREGENEVQPAPKAPGKQSKPAVPATTDVEESDVTQDTEEDSDENKGTPEVETTTLESGDPDATPRRRSTRPKKVAKKGAKNAV